MSQFDQHKYNNPATPKEGGGSGLSAGVESGLSMVQPVDGPEPGQGDRGATMLPVQPTGPAGSKGGKSFEWDPPGRG